MLTRNTPLTRLHRPSSWLGGLRRELSNVLHARGFRSPAVMTSAGLRLLTAGLRRRWLGQLRYQGTAVEICEQITRRCFNPERRCFMASPASYAEFWARDFGRCVPALLGLGFEREVHHTYRYALSRYEAAGHFALVITPGGRLFDFPGYAPDGFAFFLFGLEQLADRTLVAQHRSFLVREVERFATVALDPWDGMVRRHTCFSEAQDYVVRDSSCYSNALCHLVQRSLDALGLPNPLAPYDYRALVVERFWDGDHFLDDQTRPPYASGDAQLLPFWTGLLGRDQPTRDRLDAVLAWMDRRGLNAPLPCRYGTGPHPRRRMHPLHRVNPWQTDTVWTCLGLHYLEVLRALEHPRYPAELGRYRALVERVGCFPEVLDGETGDLYRGPLIMSEDSMIWAASLWHLLAEASSARAPAHETRTGE